MDIMQEEINKIDDWIMRVSDWNHSCGTDPMNDDMYQSHVNACKEELKELRDKGIGKDDETEIKDGIADVIVTMGYLALLNSKRGQSANPEFNTNLHAFCHYGDMIESHLTLLDTKPGNIAVDTAYYFYKLGQFILGMRHTEELNRYIEAVLDSNDTKILKGMEQEKIDYQVNFAKDKYGHEFDPDGIVYVETRSNTGVIRSNHGSGKILKPSVYKTPQEFL